MAYIERVGQSTKCDRVTEQIKNMIISGTYKTGDKLPPEPELCELFGVSRITIRESLKKLNVMGMIEIKQGKGTFVKPIDLGTFMKPLYQLIGFEKIDIQTIYGAREHIEGGIAHLAASNRSEEELRELERIVLDLKDAIEKGDIALVESLDTSFHLQLATCSHNTLLRACIEAIEEINTACKIRVNKYHMMLEDCFAAHYAIFEKVRDGDAEGAKAAMIAHTRESRELLLS